MLESLPESLLEDGFKYCPGSNTSITFVDGQIPSGANGENDYNYQWQVSEIENGSYVDVSEYFEDDSIDDSNIVLNLSNQQPGTLFYKCIVSSNYGCDSDETNTTQIDVWPSITFEEIYNPSAICNYQSNVELSIVNPEQDYNYEWTIQLDGGENDGEDITNQVTENNVGETIYINVQSQNIKVMYEKTSTTNFNGQDYCNGNSELKPISLSGFALKYMKSHNMVMKILLF